MFTRLYRRRCGALLLSALSAAVPASSGAQTTAPLTLTVDGEAERYLRVLQTLGEAPRYPWSLRAFSSRELALLVPELDRRRVGGTRELSSTRRELFGGIVSWNILPMEADGWFNSALPYGANDGPVWRGRGLTGALTAGVAAQAGPVSLTLAPTAFRTQNRAFELVPNGRTGSLAFASTNPIGIDLPQRFGDQAYGRIDPGQSTVRIDAFGLTAGISTANEWWGPMTRYPYLMSDNAAGFPHVFAGSSTPWNVGIGRLHARVEYGSLGQSEYTTIPADSSRRFSASLVAVFVPAFAPNLEVGGGRFYHAVWPASGLTSYYFRRPFDAFLRSMVHVVQNPNVDSTVHRNLDSENQLASAFFRWVAPGSGFEVYGEYGREDHNWDTSDFLQEPDHESTYGLGFSRAWKLQGARLTVLRAEMMTSEPSVLGRHRGQSGIYGHSYVRQGHTQLGQALGTAGINGRGANAMVAVDRYGPTGRLTVSWERTTPVDQGGTTNNGTPRLTVQHALALERTWLRGAFEVGGGAAWSYQFNREFTHDVGNLAISTQLRWLPR